MGEDDSVEQQPSPAVRVRTQLLAMLGLVAAGALVAYLVLGNGQPSSSEPGGDAAPTSRASSPPGEAEVLSVEEITQSQPTGQWRAQIIGRQSLLRSGAREPLDYRQQPNTWTFTSESCTADGCTGTVSSSSGRDFAYSWDGRELVVDRHLSTDTSGKLACSDESGDPVPISEAAAIHTYRYSFGSFAGSAGRLASRVVIEISTEFVGSCQAAPDDAITYVEDQVLTKLPEG
jgi:hypothetical protein